MIKIPTFQSISADFTQEIDLNGQLVNIRIIYNTRNGFFHLRFTDPDGVQVTGIKMVPNFPLLRARKATLNFSGDLLIHKDDESAGDLITYNNLNNGWGLYYFTDAEFESWKETNGLE